VYEVKSIRKKRKKCRRNELIITSSINCRYDGSGEIPKGYSKVEEKANGLPRKTRALIRVTSREKNNEQHPKSKIHLNLTRRWSVVPCLHMQI